MEGMTDGGEIGQLQEPPTKKYRKYVGLRKRGERRSTGELVARNSCYEPLADIFQNETLRKVSSYAIFQRSSLGSPVSTPVSHPSMFLPIDQEPCKIWGVSLLGEIRSTASPPNQLGFRNQPSLRKIPEVNNRNTVEKGQIRSSQTLCKGSRLRSTLINRLLRRSIAGGNQNLCNLTSCIAGSVFPQRLHPRTHSQKRVSDYRR